jgi:acetyl-CoA synthetase
MRRLLKDISEKRQLGDVTTLANEGVVSELSNLAAEAKAADDD